MRHSKSTKPPGYTKTPNYLPDVLMRELPQTQYLVLLQLHRLTRGYHREWRRISQRKLAERVGKSYRWIRTTIDSLESDGYLESRNGIPGRSHDYRLTSKCFTPLDVSEQGVGSSTSPPLDAHIPPTGEKKGVERNVVKDAHARPVKTDTQASAIDTRAMLDAFRGRHPDAVRAGKLRTAAEKDSAKRRDRAWSRGAAPPP
jgi:DNA-binding Lrp family transcriptional regulator